MEVSRTKILKINGNDLNFNSENSKEFSLLIDGKYCDGQSGWNLISIYACNRYHDKGKGATSKTHRR